jgi:hypothetical protein
VQFVPQAAGDDAAMFVSRACLVESGVPAGAGVSRPAQRTIELGAGTLRVRARLSREQAESVVANGKVPAALVEAVRQRAELENWSEADARSRPVKSTANVDAEKFFPGTKPAADVPLGW